MLWTPNNRNTIRQIEKAQRISAKSILNDYDPDYYSSLLSGNILPLTFRREFLDLVFLFNSMHNLNAYAYNFINFDIINMFLRDRNMLHLQYKGPVPRTESSANLF